MRRPPHQKTSPRTLALPGFVVSGISKMRGLMGSVVSFERVQMRPYRCSPLLGLQAASFAPSHSNAGGAPFGKSFSRVEHCEPTTGSELHLNAFKWLLPVSKPSARMTVPQPIAMGPSTPLDGERPEHPRDQTQCGLSCRQRGLAWCRGMERALGQRLSRVTVRLPDSRLSQIARAQAATARELARPSEPVLELWNHNLLTSVDEPASTPCSGHCLNDLWAILAFSFSDSHPAVAVRRRVRTPRHIRGARAADHLRSSAASFLSSRMPCTTTDSDTSWSIEARLQFVSQCASTATTSTLGCRTRSQVLGGECVELRDDHARRLARRHEMGAGSTTWPRPSDESRSSLSDAELSTPGKALCRRSSEWLSRPHSASAIGVSCERPQRKVRASRVPLPSVCGCPRPQPTAHQDARTHHPDRSFERVQMTSRPGPIDPAGRTPAPAATSGHSVTGGTPMHRLK